MKIYGIAKTERVCFGHGNYGDTQKIHRLTHGWEDGPFPLFFTSKGVAEAYLSDVDIFSDHEIVELELVEEATQIANKS